MTGIPLRVGPGQRGRKLSAKSIASAALGLPIAVSVLAACGGSGDSGAAPAAGGGSGTVSVQQVSGLGQTLVDASGKTLYFSDQEAGGTIRCTGDCLGFWYPATVQDASAVGGQTPGLATMTRPDNGQQQLTYQGNPLYTFRLDTNAGDHMGDNFVDDFSGQQFNWHAATVGAREAPAPPPAQNTNPYSY